MSVTYGYDLKGGDKILEAPVQNAKLLSRLGSPGRALVNYLPFRAVLSFVLAIPVMLYSLFQCGTFLHGSHTSATNHWFE
jgi:hypothetical protein